MRLPQVATKRLVPGGPVVVLLLPGGSLRPRAHVDVRSGSREHAALARVLRHSRVRAPVGSSRGALVVRAGPFRNPFDRDKSKPDKAEDGVTGFRALADRVRKGRDKAAKDGFQSVLADVRDGISDRNYGNGGSWPEAAEARRTKRCPLCGASTAEALRAAEEKGIVANPSADPVEKALLGQHPLGWCASCAESNRLLDTTSGF